MRAAGHATGFYCKSRPVLYSASRRLAYMKTPKGASLAIQELFQKSVSSLRYCQERKCFIATVEQKHPIYRLLFAQVGECNFTMRRKLHTRVWIASLVEELIDRVNALHSYDCPCVVAWPIENGNPDYLQWVDQETR